MASRRPWLARDRSWSSSTTDSSLSMSCGMQASNAGSALPTAGGAKQPGKHVASMLSQAWRLQANASGLPKKQAVAI